MSDQPLAGRRIYFVGIGGAGLSAYANFARAWGAEVCGWDRNETIFLEAVQGAGVDIGGEPAPPPGYEVVVSAAHARRIEGRSRAAFLAELVGLRRAIVVGGAHGKTTTAAMVAYVLRELGQDPAWIIGGVVPQLGGNAGAGSGWLVVEGDESDRSIALLNPEIAVVTNVELDHHATYASVAELAAFFEAWLVRAPIAVRGWELAPAEVALGIPGEHNRMNAAAALAALELAGLDRSDAERAIAGFTGVGRRFELVGERGGVRVIDDYGHNPTEIAAALTTARSLEPRRLVAVYQPHVYERTRQLHRELGAALGLADAAIAGFTGVGRRFELVGERGGVRVIDDYGHNPTEIAAALTTARSLEPRSLVAVYQPHVYERTRQLHRELGAVLGLADVVIVTDVIGDRDPPITGISGKTVLDDVPGGVRRGWAPTLNDAAALALAWVRPGDVVVTLGVGEPWRIARAVVEGLPA